VDSRHSEAWSGEAEEPDGQQIIYPPRGPIAFARRLSAAALARLRAALGEEEAYGSRFLLLPVFLAIGIISYFNLGFEPGWPLLAASALFCAGLIYLCRDWRPGRIMAGFALAACLGALAAKGETERFAAPIVATHSARWLTVRILHKEQLIAGGWRLLAETAPAKGGRPMRLSLSARQLPAQSPPGAGLCGLVFLRPFSGPARPYGYDFALQNYFRGIGGQGSFAGTPQPAAIGPPGLKLRAALWLADLRARMTARIIAAVGEQRGPVAAALITGERAGISAADNQALRQAGLAHILAISGLHMAMVAGLIMLVCRKILALFPVFASRFAARKLAAGCALLAAAFYLALSGADIAAARSFIMVAVMLIAVIGDRAAISLRNLAIAAIILMLWRPHEIMGPSFQMSFAACAALIAAFNAWSFYLRRRREAEAESAAAQGRPAKAAGAEAQGQWRRRLHGLILRPIISTCAASVVAGAAGGVYSAYHFNNTAPFGLISNVLALPIMSVLVMPCAVLGTLLMPLHLERWPLWLMGEGVAAVQKIAYWVAGFSPAGNPGQMPPAALALLTLGMALLMFLHSGLRRFGWLIMAAGCAAYAFYPRPLAIVAENGRLAAVFGRGGAIYLNMARTDQFAARIWQISYAAGPSVPPLPAKQGRSGAAAVMSAAEKAEETDGRFSCNALYCRARLRNGLMLALAGQPEAQPAACAAADIIVLNFMASEQASGAAKTACAGKKLIAMADLALFGAAEIRQKGRQAEIIWAAGRPNRPWNSYRRYSRRARNIPS